MSVSCPFSSVEYLQGLSNIGVVDIHPYLPFSVLRRPIPGTRYQDGVGPWPYRWISHESDIEVFREGVPSSGYFMRCNASRMGTLCITSREGEYQAFKGALWLQSGDAGTRVKQKGPKKACGCRT